MRFKSFVNNHLERVSAPLLFIALSNVTIRNKSGVLLRYVYFVNITQ